MSAANRERLSWEVLRVPFRYLAFENWMTPERIEDERRTRLSECLRCVEESVIHGGWREVYTVDINWRDLPDGGEWWAMVYGDKAE